MPRLHPDDMRALGSSLADQIERLAEIRDSAERYPDSGNLRTDFEAFLYRVGRDRRDRPLLPSPYASILASTLVYCYERRRHLAHMAPPGFGKSTIVRLFLVWLLGNNPTLATVINSAEEKIARRQVGLCRKIILSQAFRAIFPEVQPDLHRGQSKLAARLGPHQPAGSSSTGGDVQGWTVKEFFFRNVGQGVDPAMAADSVMPTTEARRTDVLYADDVMSLAVASSAALRERCIEAMLQTWIDGRLSEGRMAVVTHNCWSKLDLIHRLEPDVRFLQLRIGVESDCSSLFVRLMHAPADLPLVANPAKFRATPIEPRDGATHEFRLPLPEGRESVSREKLLELQRNQPGTFRLSRELKAVNPDDLMFPDWAARRVLPGTAAEIVGLRTANGRPDGLPVADDRDRMRLTFLAGLDLASLKRRGTALWFLAVHNADLTVYPLELHCGQFTDLELVDLIENAERRGIHCREIVIENNALQDRVIATISGVARQRQLSWWGRITPFLTGQAKSHPELGLPVLNTMLASGQFVWPDGESRLPGRQAWIDFETDMATLPRDLSVGPTPDKIMALWFPLTRLTRSAPPAPSLPAAAVTLDDDLDGLRGY